MSTSTAQAQGTRPAGGTSSGMIPRAWKKRVGADSATSEMLERIAEVWYPGVSHLEELSAGEQKKWIRFREAVIRGQYSLADLAKTLSEAIKEQSSAEKLDLELRRKADLHDQDERRKAELKGRETRLAAKLEASKEQKELAKAKSEADLADQKQERDEREARSRERTAISDQDVLDRVVRRKNDCRRDHLLMGVTTISFACTMVLILLGAFSGQPIAYGGSAITAAFSAGGLFKIFLFGQNPLPPPASEPAKAES